MTAPNCLDSICASILRYLRKIVIDYSISEINSRGNSGHWDGLGNPYYLIFLSNYVFLSHIPKARTFILLLSYLYIK